MKEDKIEEEPKQQEQETAPQPSLQEAIKEQAREDEAAQSTTFTLRKILGGDFLTAEMLRRQIGVILLIVVFVIIYISNRYSCQQKICRESNVLEMLRNNRDSTLKIPTLPPYIIEVP